MMSLFWAICMLRVFVTLLRSWAVDRLGFSLNELGAGC